MLMPLDASTVPANMTLRRENEKAEQPTRFDWIGFSIYKSMQDRLCFRRR